MKAGGLRAADAFRLACHNLWQNKSRTALTVVIVAVISSLIMVICVVGVSFLQNMTDGGKTTFELTGAEYSLNREMLSNYIWNMEYAPLTEEDRLAFDEIAEKYTDVFDRKEYAVGSVFGANGSRVNYHIHWGVVPPEDATGELYRGWFDEQYPGEHFQDPSKLTLDLADLTVADLDGYGFGGQERILEGRKWSAADNALPNVWVGSDVVEKLAREGKTVSAGDAVTFVSYSFNYSSPDAEPFTYYYCTVAGIFDSDSTRLPESVGYTAAKELIVGQDFLNTYASYLQYEEINLEYRPPQSGYDFWGVYEQMKEFVSEVNERFPPYTLSGREYTRFSCTYLDYMRVVDLITLVVAAVLLGISAVILLLSVGSIVNTILISVDKNRRFLGLLKALGMRQKDVRRMTAVEILLMVIMGVALGIGVLYALRGAIFSLMRTMFSAMFSELPFELAVGVWVPFWLPLVTAAAFFLFTFLFSRRSVKRFAKRNVIETVSEVM